MGKAMNFCELVKKNRSKRSFRSEEKIPYDALLSLCELARNCPAAMNAQPLKYRLVSSDEECALMVANTRWASSLEKKLPPRGHEPSGFIVLCHDLHIAEEKPIFLIDAGIVAQTMMLGATEMGFGGCIIGSGKAETLRELLNLPSHLVPVLVLGLGVPEETVVLTEATGGAVKYYRDENNIHYVPKRPLSELIIEPNTKGSSL